MNRSTSLFGGAVLTICCLALGSARPAQVPCVPLSSRPAGAARPIGTQGTRSVFIDFDGDTSWKHLITGGYADTVIVQRIFGRAGRDTVNDYETTRDLLRLVADTRPEMVVIVGLVYDSAFDPSEAGRKALDAASRDDIRRAREFWSALSKDERAVVGGWYLAREISNASDDGRAGVQRYLHKTAEGLPVAGGRVLIAPFFTPPTQSDPGTMGPAKTAAYFHDIVDGTRITDVAVQDGIGARNEHGQSCHWSRDSALSQSAVFMDSIGAAMDVRRHLWATVEMFGHSTDGDTGQVLRSRIARQLSQVPPTRPVVAFAYRECVATGYCAPRVAAPARP